MMPNLDRKSDWPIVSFGDVVTHIKDRVQDVMECGLQEYIRGEHFEPANLRLIGRSTLGDGKHGSAFCMRFRPGDVLYVSRNPQLRKAAIADFEGICANTTYVCRAKEEYLLQDLLPFIMQTESFVEYTIRHKRGSTNFYLNWSDIAGYEFALPPLEEQRRIAEVLQAAENCSTNLKRLCKAAGEAHRALRLQLFKLDSHSKWNRTRKIPAGWEATTIGAVSDFLDGKRVPLKSADRSKRQGPYPYYGASGIIDHIDDYIFDENLLLVSEDGANLVDRTTPIAFEVSGKIWVNNHAHVLRAKPPFSNFLIAEYIESLNVEPFVTGTAQPKINKAACEGIPIPLPPTDVLADIERRLRESVAVLKSCRERVSGSKELNQAALRELLITEAAEL